MTVDKSTLKDLFKNRSEFREKIMGEVPTFESFQNSDSFENQLSVFMVSGAHGDFKMLLKDIGLKKEDLKFNRVSDLQKGIEKNYQNVRDEDKIWTPIDMTDYEDVQMQLDYEHMPETGGRPPEMDAVWNKNYCQ